ncbi:hypothetical protein LTS14_007819 [Recurvomyces mirabilis]|uniref:uncharacterized protein n=1 Tax=Recurvomyces mirabilis TaxID=574656 RepID=UPI002DDFCEE2|nr:hypothetical protein LTS14_007819 [Recurvomyces mirabilis]
MASSFYQPLPSPNHIRVLDLSTTSSKDQQPEIVECSLRLLDLSDPDNEASYDAVSYTWKSEPGEPDGIGHIMCSGHELPVGRNLYEALKQLRTASEAQLLWADAICINQNDLEERAQQVRLMGSVFHKARCVHCWLGIGDDESRLALRNIGRLGCALREKLTGTHEASEQEIRPRFNDPAIFERIEQRPWTDLEWYDIGQNFGRAWFSRAWTLQELTLATSSMMWIGSQTCKGTDLSAFIDFISRMGWAYPIHDRCGFVSQRGAEALIGCESLRLWQGDRSIRQHAISNLLVGGTTMYGKQAHTVEALSGYLVETCRGRHTTDPRDCVFAPLALVVVYLEVIGPVLVTPQTTMSDYTLSAGPIYIDFTSWLIKGTRSLTIIGQAERTQQFDEAVSLATLGQKLPSWAPDYSCRAKRLLVPSRRQTAFDVVAPASAWDACSGQQLMSTFVDQQSHLHLDGYRLTTVRQSQPACGESGYHMLRLLALAEGLYEGRSDLDWVQQLAEVLAGGSPSVTRAKEDFRTQFGHCVAIDSTMSAILRMLFYG